MIRFGPAGNSQSFYEEHKQTWEAAAWLQKRSLTAFEYPFGHGVRMGEETAEKIRQAFADTGIALSAHAPYFINLAHDRAEEERFEKNMAYILDTARLCGLMGGNRVVIHLGSRKGADQETILQRCIDGLREALLRMDDFGLSHITLCPETMGKKNQFGNLEEILRICEADERLLPTIDFAHLHALNQGALRAPEDFTAILDALVSHLGEERAKRFHAHFSSIEYTKAGELRHRTFAEKEYGPDFTLLAPLLLEGGFQPTIICECAGTQAEDAAAMRDFLSTL